MELGCRGGSRGGAVPGAYMFDDRHGHQPGRGRTTTLPRSRKPPLPGITGTQEFVPWQHCSNQDPRWEHPTVTQPRSSATNQLQAVPWGLGAAQPAALPGTAYSRRNAPSSSRYGCTSTFTAVSLWLMRVSKPCSTRSSSAIRPVMKGLRSTLPSCTILMTAGWSRT